MKYRVVSLVWRCHLGLAPAYLIDLCQPVSGVQGSRSLRSAERGVVAVPFARTATMQNRAFSVVGPRVWNSLQRELRTCTDTFYGHLKTYLFGRTGGALLSSYLEGALYKFLNE